MCERSGAHARDARPAAPLHFAPLRQLALILGRPFKHREAGKRLSLRLWSGLCAPLSTRPAGRGRESKTAPLPVAA